MKGNYIISERDGGVERIIRKNFGKINFDIIGMYSIASFVFDTIHLSNINGAFSVILYLDCKGIGRF